MAKTVQATDRRTVQYTGPNDSSHCQNVSYTYTFTLTLFLQVKDFKPLSRAFLQLLSRTNTYHIAQTHEA